MNQLFNTSIDSVDVTNIVSLCTVSETMNRIYDIATFMIATTEEILLEKEIIINYGSQTFTGFVYSVSKTGKNSFKVEGRTYSSQLTEPYSPHETKVDDATTSHELCALFASESGVPITITSEDLDFGGSYERNGTMLSALLNVASVTGAEYYNDSGTVKIVPNKAINSQGTEIPKSDIFDFVANGMSVYNKGVGYITIQNGGDVSTDVISLNRIYAEIDECTGETFVYPNPSGVLEHTEGVSTLNSIVLERKEDQGLLDKDIMTLDGAIESIKSVTLNGSKISNYNFEQGHNVLYFNTLIRGTLEVTYKAYCYKGYANVSVTPLGRFITFDMYYLDQVLQFQGFLSPDCANVSTDGDITCIVPYPMQYNLGFTVYTIGGDPEFFFYDKNIEIERNVVSTAGNYISVEDVTLEETATGYRYRTRYDIGTALGARSAGVDVSYTTSVDGDDYYFEFTTYYPRLVVSYETPAISHYVQFSKIDEGVITMVIKNNNTDQICEYDIESGEIPCALNQYVMVDIASELSLEVSAIRGISIDYLTPQSSTVPKIIDVFGFINVWVYMDGDYVIDTSSLKIRTSITLTSNVAGS